MKSKLGSIFEKLDQSHNQREQVRNFDMNPEKYVNGKYASTQFLQTQKSKLIELQELLGR